MRRNHRVCAETYQSFETNRGTDDFWGGEPRLPSSWNIKLVIQWGPLYVWNLITIVHQKERKAVQIISRLYGFFCWCPLHSADDMTLWFVPWCQKPSGWTPFLAGISLLRISIHAQGWSWCPGPWEAGSWTCNPSLVDLPHPCICVIASYGEGLDWSLSIIDICWEIFSWETICSCLESN